ncbi:MAG TPA: hypothetical protein VMV89_09710 [Candidatus Paceibacterota bacterium]|nr:hypothetical protein [Candidatus Paceibacterota bacterium]
MMKLALAIICSLMLAGSPFLSAQTLLPAGCAKQPASASCHCHHGCKMPCCQAKSSPTSPSAPVVPQTTGQNQLSLLAAGIVAWILPDAPVTSIPSAAPISFVTKDTPLYARNCVRLI